MWGSGGFPGGLVVKKPFPSPADLPDPGIEPGSPELQEDSLPAELPGEPPSTHTCTYTKLKFPIFIEPR